MKTLEKTVLILDDEEIVRQSFGDFFEDCSWKTFSICSAPKALKLIETENIDCALVDIRLLEMDGDEFIRKASKVCPEMVFIICTGSPEYNIPEDLRAAPYVSNKLFRKPVTDFITLEKEFIKLINSKSQQ
jgi:DNA-binding NtrC family response regulator